MSQVKEAILEVANGLPDQCSWDEAMYRLYARRKIEAALKEADEGKWISHEEMVEEFEQMKQGKP